MIDKKKCSKCKIVKSLNLFYKNKATKNGKMVCCKECHNESAKKYRQSNKGREYLKAYGKEYRQLKKDKIARKEYRQSDKGRKVHSEGAKRFRQSDKGKKYQKTYRQSEKDKVARKEYNQSEKGKKLRNKNAKKYYQRNDILVKLRSRVYAAFKEYSTTGKIKSSDEYGIVYKAIIKHLGPSPNTLGKKDKFHIDHIIPLSKFDFDNPKHIKIAFSSENHQWLSKKCNLIKYNKIPNNIPNALMKQINCIGLEI